MSDTFRVEVGAKGRIVIPAAVRRQLGAEQGAQLIGVVDADGFHLMNRDAARRRLRELFEGGEDLVEELVAIRRAEATAEQT